MIAVPSCTVPAVPPKIAESGVALFQVVLLSPPAVGHQFDDDLNVAKILPGTPQEQVGLPAYSVTNLSARETGGQAAYNVAPTTASRRVALRGCR